MCVCVCVTDSCSIHLKLKQYKSTILQEGFPGGPSGKEPICQCRRHKKCGFDPWIEKIPWKREWQPTPFFLLEKFCGQRSMVGHSLWGRKELDMIKHAVCLFFFLLVLYSKKKLLKKKQTHKNRIEPQSMLNDIVGTGLEKSSYLQQNQLCPSKSIQLQNQVNDGEVTQRSWA